MHTCEDYVFSVLEQMIPELVGIFLSDEGEYNSCFTEHENS